MLEQNQNNSQICFFIKTLHSTCLQRNGKNALVPWISIVSLVVHITSCLDYLLTLYCAAHVVVLMYYCTVCTLCVYSTFSLADLCVCSLSQMDNRGIQMLIIRNVVFIKP